MPRRSTSVTRGTSGRLGLLPPAASKTIRPRPAPAGSLPGLCRTITVAPGPRGGQCRAGLIRAHYMPRQGNCPTGQMIAARLSRASRSRIRVAAVMWVACLGRRFPAQTTGGGSCGCPRTPRSRRCHHRQRADPGWRGETRGDGAEAGGGDDRSGAGPRGLTRNSNRPIDKRLTAHVADQVDDADSRCQPGCVGGRGAVLLAGVAVLPVAVGFRGLVVRVPGSGGRGVVVLQVLGGS
jgi:hypothetical protein